MKTKNNCLDNLVDSSYQGLNRRFILLSENDADRTRNTRNYLFKGVIKTFMIAGRKIFDEFVKKNIRK